MVKAESMFTGRYGQLDNEFTFSITRMSDSAIKDAP